MRATREISVSCFLMEACQANVKSFLFGEEIPTSMHIFVWFRRKLNKVVWHRQELRRIRSRVCVVFNPHHPQPQPID